MSIYEENLKQFYQWLNAHSPTSEWADLAQHIETLTESDEISDRISAWCEEQGIVLGAGGAVDDKSICNTPYPETPPAGVVVSKAARDKAIAKMPYPEIPPAAVPLNSELLNALRRTRNLDVSKQELLNALRRSTPPAPPAQEQTNAVKKP